jgi:hypothetical protein
MAGKWLAIGWRHEARRQAGFAVQQTAFCEVAPEPYAEGSVFWTNTTA